MLAGLIYKMKVLRKTNIGYMLSYNGEEVFLHNKEAICELTTDDVVDVFLYYDREKRLAATMAKPSVTIYEPGWVTTEDTINAGVFVNIGINKGILISKDFLPYDKSLWPNTGSKLFCMLKEKNNNLLAKIVNTNDVKEYATEENIDIDDVVTGIVSRIESEGLILYTDKLSVIRVHKTQVRSKYKLGDKIDVKIIEIDERGIHGSMLEQKENMIESDSKIILEYLQIHKRINEDISPEEVLELFNMSKKAYKRAIGHLYKERIIDFIDGKYILK